MDTNSETYLVIRFSSLGNVAMLVPVLASVAKARPKAKFVVLTQSRFADMFFGMDNVEVYPAERSEKSGKRKSALRLFKEVSSRYKVTHVFDLQRDIHSTMLDVLFAVSGIRVTRIETDRLLQWRLLRNGYSRSEQLPTGFERYGDAFMSAGLVWSREFASLQENRVARASLEKRFGEKKCRWLGIAPFAKSKTNMLPYSITKAVIAHYASEADVRVFLFGAGRVECEMLSQWAERYENVTSVAGQLRLSEELELMRKLDLMLGMDSANQHLASLVGLRCLTVWCGTHPFSGFYGWEQREEDIIQQPLSCRPCTVHGKNRCKYYNYLCRQESPAKIIDRMAELLKL